MADLEGDPGVQKNPVLLGFWADFRPERGVVAKHNYTRGTVCAPN